MSRVIHHPRLPPSWRDNTRGTGNRVVWNGQLLQSGGTTDSHSGPFLPFSGPEKNLLSLARATRSFIRLPSWLA
jgi:hypothetical protein